MQKWQIQTAPGSATAYCSVGWKTVLTERKAFVVRKWGGAILYPSSEPFVVMLDCSGGALHY